MESHKAESGNESPRARFLLAHRKSKSLRNVDGEVMLSSLGTASADAEDQDLFFDCSSATPPETPTDLRERFVAFSPEVRAHPNASSVSGSRGSSNSGRGCRTPQEEAALMEKLMVLDAAADDKARDLGAGHPKAVAARVTLARALLGSGRGARAEAEAAKALAALEGTTATAHFTPAPPGASSNGGGGVGGGSGYYRALSLACCALAEALDDRAEWAAARAAVQHQHQQHQQQQSQQRGWGEAEATGESAEGIAARAVALFERALAASARAANDPQAAPPKATPQVAAPELNAGHARRGGEDKEQTHDVAAQTTPDAVPSSPVPAGAGGPAGGEGLRAALGLAHVSARTGRVSRAASLYAASGEALARKHGPASPQALACMYNLAVLRQQAGEGLSAVEAAQAAAPPGSGGGDGDGGDGDGGGILSSGALLRASPRALYEQVVAGRAATLGPHHRDTLRAEASLSHHLVELGDGPAAIASLTRLLRGRASTAGPHSAAALAATLNLATMLEAVAVDAGGRRKAARCYAAARAGFTALHSGNAGHQRALDASHGLARVLLAAARARDHDGDDGGGCGGSHSDGDSEVASRVLGLLRDVVRGRQRALGRRHVETLEAQLDLARALRTLPPPTPTPPPTPPPPPPPARAFASEAGADVELLCAASTPAAEDDSMASTPTAAASAASATSSAAAARLEQARGVYAATVAGLAAALGPAHAATVGARRELGGLLVEAAAAHAAAAQRLLGDAATLLAPGGGGDGGGGGGGEDGEGGGGVRSRGRDDHVEKHVGGGGGCGSAAAAVEALALRLQLETGEASRLARSLAP